VSDVAAQNLEAEENVLGAILLAGTHGPEASASVLAAVSERGLRASDFYRASHALLYEAACEVAGQGEPTDVLALEARLLVTNRLEPAGGEARLRELAHLVPALANAGHYARLVVEAAERREEERTALALREAARNGGLEANPEVREQVGRLLAGRRSRGSAVYVIEELSEFAAVDEPGADPLVRARSGVAIPADGVGLSYGDGGAGKTTLCIDWAVHFAAGETWIDLLEPTRPLRVLLIENEGPRAEFRRKLRQREAAWNGSPLGDRVKVLSEPWAQVTLRDEAQRRELAEAIEQHELDLIIPGPLASLGMIGAGNAEDVQAFLALLADVRARTQQRFAFLLVHHENRTGKVSGAWEPHPDLLVHVMARGRGSVRVHWQKVRWASALHKTTTHLRWAEGATFELDEQAEPSRPERTYDALADYVLAHGGCGWVTVEKAITGEAEYLRHRRDSMLADGVLINAGTEHKFELWHRDDPVRPRTVSEDRHASDTPVSGTGGEDRESERVGVSPPKGRHAYSDTLASLPPGDNEEAARAAGEKARGASSSG
jgi:hypothetical protein